MPDPMGNGGSQHKLATALEIAAITRLLNGAKMLKAAERLQYAEAMLEQLAAADSPPIAKR